MKWFAVLLTLGITGISQAWAAEGQKPVTPPAAVDHTPKATVNISPGEITPTPEMWFYEQQMRQYQDPKNAVRQKAEFRTAERMRRLAATKWYGISNARPTVGVDNIHGDYGPAWSSGNPARPQTYMATPAQTLVR